MSRNMYRDALRNDLPLPQTSLPLDYEFKPYVPVRPFFGRSLSFKDYIVQKNIFFYKKIISFSVENRF